MASRAKVGSPFSTVTTVKRPERLFSFTDWSKTRPREPHPGDRLDAMFMELAEAIRTTQDALAELRRDDGKLRNASIGREQLDTGLFSEVVNNLQQVVEPVRAAINAGISETQNAERNAALYAKDAEAAVNVAKQITSGIEALRLKVESGARANNKAAEVADIYATDSENWANYSRAQADNAIAAKDEALQWAEYLAGPVVDAAHAPDFIEASKFPNGLFYQPVEGGMAGLWSAKWWALQAYNLVGAAGQFFLGPWPAGPLPGEQNPATGQVAPNPIPPGSIYYDTTSHQVMVWNGSAWKTSVAQVSSFHASYVYEATDGQQDFSGPDTAGQTPDVGDFPSMVHVNGVRLVPGLDYSIDVGTDTLHISTPLTATSMVQWDLLVPPAPSTAIVKVWKMLPLVPDGSTQDFSLTYVNASSATVPANVGSSPELLVSLDGALQEPGADFSASGSALHLSVVPPADAHLWAVWFEPEAVP